MNEINNPSRLKKLKINFPKFSMKSAEDVDLSDIDLEKLAQKPVKKRKENYPATSYKLKNFSTEVLKSIQVKLQSLKNQIIRHLIRILLMENFMQMSKHLVQQ